MAKDTSPTGPTRADWVGDALLVALLPPLVPMLVFVVTTTMGGFRNEGENYYMPLLSEIWALALGAVWWGAPNLALTPATLFLRHHAPSLIVGLCYAALIAAIATALVTHFGWLGDPYEWKWSVGMLAAAPLFVTSLLAFILAMSATPVRGGLLVWLFGDATRHEVHQREPDRVSGFLELEHADVRWLLSTRADDLPDSVRAAGGHAHRTLAMDGEEIEFSGGFTDLHSTVYREVLAGRGFGIDLARPSIELSHQLRTADIIAPSADHAHPALRRPGGGAG